MLCSQGLPIFWRETLLGVSLQRFGAAFSSNADVAGVALQLGMSAETVNVYNQSRSGVGCANQAQFELQVTCAEYIDFVQDAISWYRAAFPDKILTLNTGLGACTTLSDWKAIREFMTYAEARGVYYRYNGLQPDSSNVWRYGGNAPYGRHQYGLTTAFGAGYEPGAPLYQPSFLPTAEAVGFTADMLYAGAAAGGDYLFLQKEWYPYIPAAALEVITSHNVPLRGWKRAEMEAALDAAGFTAHDLFGTMGQVPYADHDSTDLVVVAR